MKMQNCQACGNPIFGTSNMGLNSDGSINSDFCSDCYKNGEFITADDDLTEDINPLVIPFAANIAFGMRDFGGPVGMY